MSTIFAAPKNNASSTIGTQTGATCVGTNITLTAGGGAKFPATPTSFRVSICQVAFAYSPTATTSNYTIYNAHMTSTADTMSIDSLSTIENDTQVDRQYNIGDVVELRVTAGTLSSIHTAVNNLEFLSNPVSVTTTKACAASDYGTTQVCSGTSANYTVTLPAPVAGGIISFRMAPGLTKLVTISQHDTSGHTDKIDGANTRVMWANESATLVSDGTNWAKVEGKSIPMQCYMYVTSGQGSQTLNNNGDTVIPVLGQQLDNTGGLMYGSSAGGSVNILRTSTYAANCFVGTKPTSSSNSGILAAKVYKNGSFLGSGPVVPIPVSAAYPQAAFAQAFPGTAGDYWQLAGYEQGLNGSSSFGTDAVNFGAGLNFIAVTEIPTW